MQHTLQRRSKFAEISAEQAHPISNVKSCIAHSLSHDALFRSAGGIARNNRIPENFSIFANVEPQRRAKLSPSVFAFVPRFHAHIALTGVGMLLRMYLRIVNSETESRARVQIGQGFQSIDDPSATHLAPNKRTNTKKRKAYFEAHVLRNSDSSWYHNTLKVGRAAKQTRCGFEPSSACRSHPR